MSSLSGLIYEYSGGIFRMQFHFLGLGVLSWITFLPIIGMIIVLLLPKKNWDAIRWTSAVFTFLQVILAVYIYMTYDRSLAGVNNEQGMQLVEKYSWID